MSIFTPRLNYNGTDTLDYYTTANPFYTMYDYDYTPPQYLWMPNCSAYAYGRWNEEGNVHTLSTPYPWIVGNGVDWWYDAPSKGFQRGQTPQLGAAMVWGYFNTDPLEGQPGHVGIVEKIEKDNNGNITSLIVSNSAFNNYEPPRYPQNNFPWFYLSKFINGDYDHDVIDGGSVYVGRCMGFVYHPNFPPGVEPLTIPKLIPLISDTNMWGNIYYKERRRPRN